MKETKKIFFPSVFILTFVISFLAFAGIALGADCPIFPSDRCSCTCCNHEFSSSPVLEEDCVSFCLLKGGIRQWGSIDRSASCAPEADCICCWSGSTSGVTESACSIFCSDKGNIRQWGTSDRSGSCRGEPSRALCTCCWSGATRSSSTEDECALFCSAGHGGTRSWGSKSAPEDYPSCPSEPSAEIGSCLCCWDRTYSTDTRVGCYTRCQDFGGILQWRSELFSCPAPPGVCDCCWGSPEGTGPFTMDACTTACQDKGGISRWSPSVGTTPPPLNREAECLPNPAETTAYCFSDADCASVGLSGYICTDFETDETGETLGICRPSEETPPEEEEEEEATVPGAPIGVLAGGLLKAAGRAGFGSVTLETTVGKLITALLGFVGIFFLGMIIFAGFRWMTAGGNTEDIDKAKKMIERAIIGLIIVFAAYAISYFLISKFLPSPPSSSCPEGQTPCTCQRTAPDGTWIWKELGCLAPADCPETCPE